MKEIIKAITDLRAGVNPNDVAIELENYVRLNISFPKKSFKWHDYTESSEYNSSLAGVLHTRGFKVATDRYVLLACKEDYNKELEGKIIDKKGNIIDKKYANWERVIPKKSTDNVIIELNYSRMKEAIKRCKIIKKVNETECIFIRVDKDFFYYKDIERFLRGAKKIGATDMRFTSPDRNMTPMFSKNDNGTILVMSKVNEVLGTYNENTGGYEDRNEYGLDSYTTDY